jgi:hypothetical protein
VPTVVVRSVARAVDREAKLLEVGLELEALEPIGSRADMSWIAADEISDLRLADRDRELLELLFSDEPHPLRPPWARRGWFVEAAAWIESTLAELGRAVLGPPAQLSNWCISSILRVPTEQGDVFFKATARSPLFVDEGAVTRGLAELFPASTPRVLAFDSQRRWMLTEDFGPLVGWGATLEMRVAVLEDHARLQVEAVDHVDELFGLGLFDRRPAWLAAQLESLLDEPDALGLEASELKTLGARIPAFVDACGRLAAGPIPDTLVHGDLHLANVAGTSAPFVFFDWTDPSVAHPFFDPLAIHFEKDAVTQRTLRDAYLTGWRAYASDDELIELWELCLPLTALNHAISYRSILANVEPGSAEELVPALPEWLRRALEADPG